MNNGNNDKELLDFPDSTAEAPKLSPKAQRILDVADAAICDCRELLDEDRSEEANDFAESVRSKLESIVETIERTNRVSHEQERAILRMAGGIERWIRR